MVAHNRGAGSVWEEIKSPADAQKCLAALLSKLHQTTPAACWWKIGNNDCDNSLAKLLDIDHNQVLDILRCCEILYGPNDSFRVANFEFVMTCSTLDWSQYRPAGKIERFIKIGSSSATDAIDVPKSMYSVGGVLELLPVTGRHIVGVRTKQCRQMIDGLLTAASTDKQDSTTVDGCNSTNKQDSSSYLQDLLAVFKAELLASGGKFSQRVERKLQRATKRALKLAATELLEAFLDRIGEIKKATTDVPMGVASAPLWSESPLVIANARAAVADISSRALFESPATLVTPQQQQQEVQQNSDVIDVDDNADILDPFITELREETILQNLLHKRLHNNSERVFHFEHRNGRKLRIVVPPDSQSTDAFVTEARKTNWVNDMLHSGHLVEGMLSYLARTRPDEYRKVGCQQRLNLNSKALTTSQTVAMARISGLNNAQLKKIRSFLQHIGGVTLKFAAKDLETIDRQIGLTEAEPLVQCGSHMYEWADSKSKGKEKRPPELCNYWTANVFKEIEAEVDMFLHDQMGDNASRNIPTIDYDVNGFEGRGVAVVFGGDHGDKACPISMKLNLTSPEERKQRGELNYHCPIIQVASVDCSKDTFGLLQNTVMPSMRTQMIRLQQSSVVVVYDYTNLKRFKSYVVFKSINYLSVRFVYNNANGADERPTMCYGYGGGNTDSIDLTTHFPDVPIFRFRMTPVISTFHDLYVGDLAFQAMLIGMKNSSGDHCLLCRYKAAQFNCGAGETREATNIRNKASLTECLNEFNRQKLSGQNPANYQGVNSVGLLDIDPQRLIVPILHCPMGLVDKILESFKLWVNLEVEHINNEQANLIRHAHQEAKQIVAQTKADLVVANQNKAQNNTPATRAAVKAAQKAKSAARKTGIAAKSNYDDFMQRHNARSGSLAQRFEVVFRCCNIKKEHYHGGKYNGVNCIRIMERSEELFLGNDGNQGFCQLIKDQKRPTVADEDIETQCARYARLLGLLDAVWSNVRGIDSGIAPTAAQINTLDVALSRCKALWLEMGLTTKQPKWHLTFDGHLLHQVRTYGGLADKADDVIELQHQVLKKQRERYRSVPTFMQRERCIRRELRRKRSPVIQGQISKYEAKLHKGKGKRPTESQVTKRAAKRVKRETVINFNS